MRRMKSVNVHITDEVHSKLSKLKESLAKPNLDDVITSLIDQCYRRYLEQTNETGSEISG